MSVSNPVLKKAAAFSKRCFRLICEYFSAGLHRDVPLSKKKRRLFRFFTFFLFVAAIAIFLTVFTIQVHNTGSREAVFKENAGIVCTDIISELGTSRIEQLYDEETENSWRMLGISTDALTLTLTAEMNCFWFILKAACISLKSGETAARSLKNIFSRKRVFLMIILILEAGLPFITAADSIISAD